MDKVVKIKDVIVGEGVPKICVPLVGKTISELIEELTFLKEIDFDILEWRVDFYEDVLSIAKVKETLLLIRTHLKSKPIIFTLRSLREGGLKEVSSDYYFTINKEVAETKLVDVIDLELFNEEDRITKAISVAHGNDIAVILSNHDFHATPPKEDIISRMCKAFALGGDMAKIAVMPHSPEDVITLLDATRIMKEQYAKGPIITMSMSGQGVISRLSGELFGSALTFGSARNPSASGQISVGDLRRTLEIIHHSLKS